jgi:hypothetical protein
VQQGKGKETMNMSLRQFLLRGNGIVVSIPNAKFERVERGEEPLKEFAGKRVRWLTVTVELKDRKPCRVLRYHASYLWLDARGFVRQRRQDEYERLKMEVAFPSRGEEAAASNAKALAMLERLRPEWEWRPTEEVKEDVEALLWPRGKP